MKEKAIKIKSYVGNVNVVVSDNDFKAKLFRYMLLSFGILAIAYVYMIGNMVFDIVARKTLETEARNLSNEVRELEIVYLNESNKIDIAFANSLGFKETQANFATRKPIGLNSFGNVDNSGNEL